MTVNEDEIVRKALATNQTGVRRFPYKGLEGFLDEIRSIYPSAVTVVVCNLDKRDALGSPWLNIHSLRPVKTTITTSSLGSHSTTHIEAVWHDVYAVVEKGMVTVKVARKSIGCTP